MPERRLESRIRAPTESPEPEAPSGSRLRLDAGNLRAVSAAAAAAAAGGQSLTGGGFTSVNQPVRGNVDTSPRGFEASGRTTNPLLAARHMSTKPAAATVGGQIGQGKQGGRPGQVYNAATKRWGYVEEVDSDVE